MELRVLRSFLTIAREKSISGAARILHITQPSLSRQMMDLEDEMGSRLFERGNRKISLTAQGLLLQRRATQIMEMVRKTEEEMLSINDEVSGSIHLGAGETRAFKVIAAALNELIGEYPDIRFHLYSGHSEDVMDRLDKGLLDFGLLIEPYDVSRYNYLRLPLPDTWGVLMRKDSELAEKASVRAEDLWPLPLICSRQALDGGQLASWLKKSPEKLRIVGTYNLIFNASLMVEAGAGHALGLEGIVNTTGESALCFRPLDPALVSQVDLVWKKTPFFSRPAEMFLAKLRQTDANGAACNAAPRLEMDG